MTATKLSLGFCEVGDSPVINYYIALCGSKCLDASEPTYFIGSVGVKWVALG